MIRKFTLADLNTFIQLRIENNASVTGAEARKLIKSFIKSDIQEGINEFIIDQDGKAIGQISFYEAGQNTYEMGIQILDEYKNTGYAYKTIKDIRDNSNGITFIANVDKCNIASIKLFSKITKNKYESDYSIQFIINT